MNLVRLIVSPTLFQELLFQLVLLPLTLGQPEKSALIGKVLNIFLVGSFSLRLGFNPCPLCGTVYGLAQSPTHKHPLRSTAAILDQVAEHLVERLTGPRFLGGDWNANLSDLAVSDYLLSHGWREVQVHAWETWQQPIRPTCKSVTVRDFLWLSPELWEVLQSVHYVDHYYPDHACPGGVFAIQGL